MFEKKNGLWSFEPDYKYNFSYLTYQIVPSQVTAVLFQILKLVHSMSSFKLSTKVKDDSEDAEGGGKVNIRWILFKLRKGVNVEVAKAPGSMNIVSVFLFILSINCYKFKTCYNSAAAEVINTYK